MTAIFGAPGPEPGDALVYEALTSLPEDWLVYAQPVLAYKSETRNPDYALVHREVGVLILEVKDWVRILKWGNKDVEISRRDSTQANETNPVIQARKAAELLSNILRENKDLCSYSGKLDFPYRYAAVLADQPMSVISQLGEPGHILGRDDLRPDLIEARLRQVPAPFYLPMEESHIRAVCAAIDPLITITDPTTKEFKGIYDRDQEKLAKEPLGVSAASESALSRVPPSSSLSSRIQAPASACSKQGFPQAMPSSCPLRMYGSSEGSPARERPIS